MNVACHHTWVMYFEHPVLTSSFTKILQVNNTFATIVNGLSVYSIYKVRRPRMTKLGQGVRNRVHYPTKFQIRISMTLTLLMVEGRVG